MALEEAPAVGRHRRLADSDSDEDTHNVLTAAKAADLCPKPYRLIARNQNLTALDDLSTLSALDYIDLSSNALSSLQGINNPRLKTLIAAHNTLTNLVPLYKTASLRVLNVSHNRLTSMDWLPHASFAAHLHTFVSSSNSYLELHGLLALKSIRTLVLSGNRIEDITPVTHLTTLVKLSASNNQIRILPCLAPLQNLTELRLAHNRIANIPDSRLPSLKILDLGHNRIGNLDPLVTFAPSLQNVNLRNNPAASQDDFQETLKSHCPRLEVVDGQRITGGRRKLRVNRLRKMAGFEIETDRKYPRLPSKYYLKPLEEKGLLNEVKDVHGKLQDSIDEPGAADEDKAAVKSAVSDLTPAKRKRVRSSDDDEPALDADKFVAMARAKVQEPRESNEKVKNTTIKIHRAKVGGESRKTKKSRKKGESITDSSEMDVFGEGGESKW